MEYRPLGWTGVTPSEAGLGTCQLGIAGWGKMDAWTASAHARG